MTIAYVNQGARSTATVSPLSVAYHATVTAGNLLLMIVINKYSTNAGPNTPSGWSTFANYQRAGGIGAPGNDAGSVLCSIFAKIADGTETGNVSVTITGTLNTSMGQIVQYSKTTGTWGYAAASGVDASAGTAWSSTTDTGGIAVASGDMVLSFIGVNGDLTTAWNSQAISQTGVTFGAATERIDDRSSSGSDEGIMMSEHPVSSGSGSGELTYTATATGSGASTPTGPNIVIRLREVTGGGSTYNETVSISRIAALTEANIITMLPSASLSRLAGLTDVANLTMSMGVSLSSLKGVSDGGALSLDVVLGALQQAKGLSEIGGMAFESALTLAKSCAVSTSYILTLNDAISISKQIAMVSLADATIADSVSLAKQNGISSSVLAEFLASLALSQSKAITDSSILDIQGGTVLSKTLSIENVGGLALDSQMDLQKSLFLSFLPGLLFVSATDLAKTLSISLSSERVVVGLLTLSKDAGISSTNSLDAVGSLPVSMSLGVGASSLSEFLAQVNLSKVNSISILAGNNIDASLIINRLSAITTDGTIGVVVFAGMVIIIDSEIVSTLTNVSGIVKTTLQDSALYSVTLRDVAV